MGTFPSCPGRRERGLPPRGSQEKGRIKGSGSPGSICRSTLGHEVSSIFKVRTVHLRQVPARAVGAGRGKFVSGFQKFSESIKLKLIKNSQVLLSNSKVLYLE